MCLHFLCELFFVWLREIIVSGQKRGDSRREEIKTVYYIKYKYINVIY